MHVIYLLRSGVTSDWIGVISDRCVKKNVNAKSDVIDRVIFSPESGGNKKVRKDNPLIQIPVGSYVSYWVYL